MALPVLQFALGLTGTPFMTTLNGVGLAMNQFTTQLTRAFAGAFKQIERGANLDALSRRTGVAAGSLYQLQEAFKQVDADAGSVPTALDFLLRSLSGVTEMGDSAQAAIAALGLSVDDLKRMRPEQAFQSVVNAMGKLSQSDALKVGQTLFGRGGGATVVQISRSLDEFNATMADTAGGGALFNRSARSMNDLLDVFTRIRRRTDEWMAILAESVLPALQSAANWAEKIDFSKAVRSVGNFVSAMVESINQGRFGELLELSLGAGFEAFLNTAKIAWAGWVEGAGTFFAKSFGDPGKFAAQMGARALGLPNTQAVFAALPGGIAVRAALQKALSTYGAGAGGEGFSIQGLMEAIKASTQGMSERAGQLETPMRDALATIVSEILAAMARNPAAAAGTGFTPGFDAASSTAAAGRSDSSASLNALERIGAVFGVGSSAKDYQRQIAENTQRMVRLLEPRNRPAVGDDYTPFTRPA